MRNDALNAEKSAAAMSRPNDYPPQSVADREILLKFVRTAPFSFGTWNRFKSLYKQVEASAIPDSELMGALLARLDDSALSIGEKKPRVALEGMRSVGGVIVWQGNLFVLRGYDYSYDDELTVFSLVPGEPMTPTKLRSLNLGIRGVSLFGATRCGSQLCVALRDRGKTTIRLVDLSDASRPHLSGEFSFGGSAVLATEAQDGPFLCVGLSRHGNNAFEGLCLVDLTAPADAQIVGELKLSGFAGEAGSLTARGGLAAMITKPVGLTWRSLPRAGGLHLIDISSPRLPRVVGTLDLQTPLCVALHGSYAYLGIGSSDANNNGMQTVDVSDPRRPSKTGFLPLSGDIVGISVSPNGNTALARTRQGLLYTVDIRDNAAPRLLDTMDGMQGASDIAFDGDLAYVPAAWQGVMLLSLADGKRPQRVGVPPSAETIGYMKRRGRRFLRNLAKADPARYADVATGLLSGLVQRDAGALDPARHWATIDTLFGGGSRFRQTKHGRGKYIATAEAARPKLRLRTREERFPAAWDMRPDLLVRLLETPNLLPAVYGFAARALRANGKPVSAFSEAILAQWLASDDPLLVVLGARAAAARLMGGASLSPTLTADTCFYAGAKVRQALARERASAWASKRDWAQAFALRLAARLAPVDPAKLRLSKRQIDSAGLLARHFSWVFAARPDILLPLVAPFLATGRADLLALIVAASEKVTPAGLVVWLTQLGRVPDARQREPVLLALTTGLAGIVLEPAALRGLVFNTEPFVREAGWRLIAGSATGGEPLRAIWTELLMSGQATPAVTTAMASADALGLLDRAGITPAEFVGHINARPYLGATLSPAAFAAVAATAPASVVLALIAASTDDHWTDIRPVLLRQLREGVGLEALLRAAEAAVIEDATGRLETRLLGDSEIVETFVAIDDMRLLEIREPAFGAILGRWWQRHADQFPKNSTLLHDAATHPLPELRTPALARVARLGMDMPFALRLVESAVPPSVVVGRSFFDAEPAGGDREADYALALCDSPAATVRTLGREYVTLRWGTLPHERILTALFENPAPEIQAFVAERLGARDIRLDSAPSFDAEVLRSTNRARQAKERIKARQTAESTLDIATLLTVARGRTPRDAEWALGELARRAMMGEVIEGVTVDGVVGG